MQNDWFERHCIYMRTTYIHPPSHLIHVQDLPRIFINQINLLFN